MKIGISCYPTFGGSGVVASELGMALARKGHEVHFITYRKPERLKLNLKNLYYHEVTVPEYPLFEYAPYSLALASQMFECSKKYKLDLIHSHYAIPHATSAILARDMLRGKIAVVTTLHGTDVTLVGQDKSFLPITKHVVEKSDAVSAVSMFLRDEVCCVFTCEKTIEVIYNFIDPNQAVRDQKKIKLIRDRFTPNGEKLLIHISNYRPVKRIPDVYKIFRRVHEEIPVKLMLLGKGPELPELLQLARNEDLSDDVIVMGTRNSISPLISAADLLLLPSASESFGLVVLEAMINGTISIATNAGGLPEVVDHGNTGWLGNVGDIEQLAGFAIRTLNDPGLQQEMERKAIQRAEEHFHIDDAIEKYEHLYSNAL